MGLSTSNFKMISSSSSTSASDCTGTPQIPISTGLALPRITTSGHPDSCELRTWCTATGGFRRLEERDGGGVLKWHFWIWGSKDPDKLWGWRLKQDGPDTLPTESKIILQVRSVTSQWTLAPAPETPKTEPKATATTSLSPTAGPTSDPATAFHFQSRTAGCFFCTVT